MKKPFEEIFAELDFLLKNYSNAMRTTVNPYRLANQKKLDSAYAYVPGDSNVQETLMEHVGTLPILATYFHEYVTEQVNLGRVLELVAVHDIGELATGDKNTFVKKASDGEIEKREALKILNPKLHDAYLEYQASETNEAKFAKSVDKIAPDILDAVTPRDITIIRLKHYANLEPEEIVATIQKHKSPYMEWSVFFKEFHAQLMEKLKTIFDEDNL